MALLTEKQVALATQVLLDSVTLVPYGDSIVYGFTLRLDPDRRLGGEAFLPSSLLRIGWHANAPTAAIIARVLQSRRESADSTPLIASTSQLFAIPGLPAFSLEEIEVVGPPHQAILQSLLSLDSLELPHFPAFAVD
jgi:hypothetical protein